VPTLLWASSGLYHALGFGGHLGEHYVGKLCAALGEVVCRTWWSPANVHAGRAKELATIQPESSGPAVEHAPEMRCGQIGSHKSPAKATAKCDVPGFMQLFSRWLARLANCGMWPPCTHPIER
jgi:hypothetical protein